MSNVSSQQAMITSNIKTLVDGPSSEPVMIQTPTGMCALFNTHLISAKLQGVIGAILNHEFWTDGLNIPAGPHVMSIVLRADGHPMKNRESAVYGSAHKEVQAFAVNLTKSFADAMEEVIALEPTLSIRAHLWHEILTTICHEVFHVSMVKNLDAVAEWTEDDAKAEEEAAKKWAQEIIISLAKSGIDIEPPSMDEEPLFQLMFMSANLNRLANQSDDATTAAWSNQLTMLSKGVMWHDPASGTTVETFSEYITVEAAGERPIEAGIVKIMNLDTHEASDPVTVSMMDLVPQASAQTHIESTFAHTGNHAEAQAVTQTPPLVYKAVDPAPVVYDAPTSVDIAEAMELAELDDYGPEGVIVEDEDVMEIPAGAQTNASLFGGPADEVVPEPAPAPEPEEKQAYVPQAVAATAHAVFTRAFQHIFNKCAPVNGVFQNPAAVYEPISIADIPGHEIFVACDTINMHGQAGRAARPGWIKGTLYKNGQLPVYVLHMNVGGVPMTRKLLPQNAAKTSKPAAEARAGNHIGWVVDAAPQGKWILKYVNGQLIPLS